MIIHRAAFRLNAVSVGQNVTSSIWHIATQKMTDTHLYRFFSEKTYRLFKFPDLPYVSEEKTERSRLRQAASDVWEGSSASSGCFQTGRVVLTHKQRSSD